MEKAGGFEPHMNARGRIPAAPARKGRLKPLCHETIMDLWGLNLSPTLSFSL